MCWDSIFFLTGTNTSELWFDSSYGAVLPRWRSLALHWALCSLVAAGVSSVVAIHALMTLPMQATSPYLLLQWCVSPTWWQHFLASKPSCWTWTGQLLPHALWISEWLTDLVTIVWVSYLSFHMYHFYVKQQSLFIECSCCIGLPTILLMSCHRAQN